MKTAKWLAVTLAFLSLPLASIHAESTPQPGVVTGDNVNVRGKASFTGEVITQLKKGEAVTILEEIKLEKPHPGEPTNWFRIAMPANTPLWTSTLFVDETNKTVKPNRLNVRSGPGEQFSVVAILEKGTEVKEISRKGDWLEIETPTNAFGFVAADYIGRPDLSAPAPAPAATPKETVVEPAKETVPEPAKESPAPAATENTEPAKAAPVEEKAAEPQPAPAETTPAPATETAPPVTTPAEATPAPAETTPAPAEATPAPATVAPEPEPVVASEPPPRRIVTREGVLTGTFSIQAPSYHALESLDTGRTINYIHSPNPEIKLDAYKGRKIRVTGEEIIDERWKTPVVELETIRIIP